MVRLIQACINIVIILLPSSHILLLSTRRLDMHQNVLANAKCMALNLCVRRNLRQKLMTTMTRALQKSHLLLF